MLEKILLHLLNAVLNWVPLEKLPRETHLSPQPRVSRKVCIYAHYDPEGRIDPYVLRQLEELASAGYAITVVSTASELNVDDVKQALRFANRVMRRSNLGHDFGSWKVGLKFIEGSEVDALILANDSVYGPFQDLGPILARMNSDADIWGMTDSREGGEWHLQSYFLCFSKKAFESSWFRQFWGGVRFLASKHKIIQRYEIGLSVSALQAGLKLKALFPIDELSGKPVNSTLHAWDAMIQTQGFPWMKTELLRKNRLRDPKLDAWEKVVPLSGHVLIRGHLSRLGSYRDSRGG